jgi:hypothetical protein
MFVSFLPFNFFFTQVYIIVSVIIQYSGLRPQVRTTSSHIHFGKLRQFSEINLPSGQVPCDLEAHVCAWMLYRCTQS